MLDIHTFVFIKASFLQDGFGILAYVKDDDGKDIITHFIKII